MPVRQSISYAFMRGVGAEAFSVSDTGAGAVLFGNFGPPGNFQQQFSGVIAPAPA